MTYYCNKCGKKISSDSVFCNYCGEKVVILEENMPETVEEEKLEVEQKQEPVQEVIEPVENNVSQEVEVSVAEKQESQEVISEKEENQVIISKQPEPEALYNVLLTSAGTNLVKVLEDIQKKFNLSLQETLKKTSKLPIVIEENCDEATALSIMTEWKKTGAKIKIVNVSTNKESKKEKKVGAKKSLLTVKILKLIRSSLFFIGAILMLFLPIVYNKCVIEEITYKKGYSIFNLLVVYAKALFNGTMQISIYNLEIIFIVILVVFLVPLFYSTATLFINDVLSFTKYKDKRKVLMFNGWKALGQIGLELLYIMLFLSLDGVYISTVIVLLALYLIAAIIENVAKNKS